MGLLREEFRVSDGADSLLAVHGLTSMRAVFAWMQGERLDKRGLETWRQRWRIQLPEPPDQVGHRTLYLKRFDRPPLRRQWTRWREGRLTSSTAGVEWSNARRLAEAGVPAVEPVAFGEVMLGPLERRSFILLAEVPGESLEHWVPRCLPPAGDDPRPRLRRTLRDQLARLAARFHAAGFVHRDLYLSHVFIHQEPVMGGDGHPRIDLALIDLQRVFRPRWRRGRWVVKDLAALDFSTPAERVNDMERLRFLCRYVRCCGEFGTARELARRIRAKTRRMARRQRRG